MAVSSRPRTSRPAMARLEWHVVISMVMEKSIWLRASSATITSLSSWGMVMEPSKPDYPIAMFPNAIAFADVHGDGSLDIISSNEGFNATSVSLLSGNGDGSFQPHQDYGGGQASSLVLQDFNNDGKLDLAVTNLNTGRIAVLLQDNGTVVELTPPNLTFPAQAVGSVSPQQYVTLHNSGSKSVSISNISATANFAELNNCRNSVPAGASCKIAVFFVPTTKGTVQGYLSVYDNGGGSPQSVGLSGIGTFAQLSPSNLNFGQQRIGSNTKKTVTLTNIGMGKLNITGIGVAGPNRSDFHQVNACGSSLAAGAHCDILVVFHPLAQGARNAVLQVSDDGGGSPQNVALSGSGQ
jgi:hypothetical protein